MQGITPIANLTSGCDYHRIILPLRHLGINIEDFKDKDPDDVLKDTKVLIFNRNPSVGLDLFLEYKKKYGFKIVCDLDDYWELYPHHHLYNDWVKDGMNKIIPENIKKVDAVFVTNSLLADKVKDLNNNVYVIPNSLPFGTGQFVSKKGEESPMTRVLYAGGSSHFWDLRSISYAIQKFRRTPLVNKCQFILGGYTDTPEWNRIERTFNLRGQLPNYLRKESLPLDSYMQIYNEADVALAPLEDNLFNRHKSNLKLLEAGCKELPCIAAKVSPYSLEDCKALLLASNVKEWNDHLKYLVQNPDVSKAMGKELGIHVRLKYSLLRTNLLRRQIFEHLSR